MTDDQYLTACYFGALAVTLALCVAGLLFLRQSFETLLRTVSATWSSRAVRRLLFAILFLPAMSALFSVSFSDCNHQTYEEIVADRAYVRSTAGEQVSEGMHEVVLAVLLLGLVGAIGIRGFRDRGTGS